MSRTKREAASRKQRICGRRPGNAREESPPHSKQCMNTVADLRTWTMICIVSFFRTLYCAAVIVTSFPLSG